MTRGEYLDGVVVHRLYPHDDARGQLVEIYRDAWTPGFAPVQWNLVRNHTNALRGFHCHVRHTDLVTVVEGTMRLGLKDLRPDSPTHDRSAVLDLTPTSGFVLIPPGVGHGFYFEHPAMILNAVSHEWSPDDDFGCRWDDPGLDIEWGCHHPVLSERDRTAGPLDDLRRDIDRRRAETTST